MTVYWTLSQPLQPWTYNSVCEILLEVEDVDICNVNLKQDGLIQVLHEAEQRHDGQWPGGSGFNY